jgi:hypothetical protein
MFSKSPLARALGVADLAALIIVIASMSAYHILLLDAPWVSWVGWFYVVLWVNKAVFTAGFGGAFPAVFGLSETGTISLNPTWYVVSAVALCALAVTAVVEAVHGDGAVHVAVAVVAAIACGRATVPPLVMSRMLATAFNRRAGAGATR